MKKLAVIAMILMLSVPAMAQDTLTGKVNYNLSVGSSFTSAGRYGSGFSSWISPRVTYQPWKRFSVQAGFTVVNTTFSNYRPWYGLEAGSSLNGNYTSTLLYVTGSYLLGTNAVITGTLYKSFPMEVSPQSDPYSRSNFQGGSVNVMYRIGNNMRIEAGFSIDNGARPLFYDPLLSPFMAPGSPVHW